MKIKYVQNQEDLFLRYPEQTGCQPVYLWINCKDKSICMKPSPEIGSAVPADVYHGHTQRLPVPQLRIAAANQLLNRVKGFAEHVFDGYVATWDGNNYVAKFSPIAKQAFTAIERIIENYCEPHCELSPCRAKDYLGGAPIRDLGIRSDYTEDIIEQIAIGLNEDAEANGVYLVDTEEYLLELRDKPCT